jgi:uncharacterized membrane protein YgcG
MKFSAVIVTRGNVDLGPVLAPIVPFADEIVIRRGHGGVWERWEAILAAKHELVYTQDDDAVVDLEAYEGVADCRRGDYVQHAGRSARRSTRTGRRSSGGGRSSRRRSRLRL